MKEVIQGEERRDEILLLLSRNIKKAYDTVFREGLWRRLREVGVVGKMSGALTNIYVKVESRVVVNEERRSGLSCTGVWQGCI